jgi:hypothetical protein
LIRIVKHKSKDLTNPHESLVHRHTLDNQILGSEWHKSSRIRFCGFENPDLDLWIQFRTWILNYSFWGFVSEEQKVKKIRFESIGKDLCTNPASLGIMQKKIKFIKCWMYFLNLLILDVFTFVCKSLYFHFKFQIFSHFMLKKVTILKIDRKCKHCVNIKWKNKLYSLLTI